MSQTTIFSINADLEKLQTYVIIPQSIISFISEEDTIKIHSESVIIQNIILKAMADEAENLSNKLKKKKVRYKK